MDNNRKPKKEPWRIIVFVLAVGYILFMWVEKDVAAIYAAAPAEQLVPLIATNITVSLMKVAVLAGALWLVRWIVRKLRPANTPKEREPHDA